MLFQLINLLLVVRIGGINLYKEEIIQGDQSYSSYEFHIHHHLSGISPYFQSNKDQLNPTLPRQCQVTKAAYLVRHGSIYVDDYDYYSIIKPFLKRLKHFRPLKWSKLSFLSRLSYSVARTYSDCRFPGRDRINNLLQGSDRIKEKKVRVT